MLRGLCCGLVLLGVIAVVGLVSSTVLPAADPAPADAPAEKAPGEVPDKPPAPITEQAYTGTDHCLECHRPQVKTWTATKHAQTHSQMPAKYQQDPACLKCHVTAYGQSGGYAPGGPKDLVEVGCEACHGPGALHENAALRLRFATPADEKKLEQETKETIVKTASDSVCAACHTTQGHRAHPAYEGQPSRPVVSDPCRSVVPVVYSSGCDIVPAWSAPLHYTFKTCGSCHYDQYLHWRTGKHATLGARLTAKYLTNQECLACHPLGTGVATIATGGTEAPPAGTLIDASCESCHGPGREHVRFNMRFIAGPRLGPELEQAARQAIRHGKRANTCILCHVRHSHKEHPTYEDGK